MEWIVREESSLIDCLRKMYPDSSVTQVKSFYQNKRVLVNGRFPSSLTALLKEKDLIIIRDKPIFLEKGIDLLYKDKDIAVIDKPKGLLSVATDFETLTTAHGILKRFFKPKRVFPVHRLDQDTSGLLIFALSEPARDNLKKSFEAHRIKRRYVAIIEGHLPESEGTWKSYLFEDPNYIVRTTDDPKGGQLAITHYAVKKTSKNLSWLEVHLETGKKNQIRVHCQKAGHSVLGDTKYGAQKKASRLFLHAESLEFIHPITNKLMRFDSPVPDIFYQVIEGR
ncbi:RluA family pseudouridine synthase [Criblamydia sequanensis]|uniref:Pseudouridine synthase n=1 Tax=Candidatus Criblamydia sequanensis CRIB-18 TaxID=1437425 RepID=A0A090CZG2_9BACT|nr:RluA family pseudouridine synthase [Criblamydia sequanensis]CDR34261.1 RNA pseudouridine synthase [Criblamydia sequanensis CRIB-18]